MLMAMARWQPDARGRLGEAALELFEEPGYDSTTVAEIAERAGLTKRTFFRYFSDKREVLFDGASLLEESMLAAVRAAPQDATAFEAASTILDGGAEVFDAERHPFAVRRQRIIDATPELQERELIKLSRLGVELAAALRDRGVGEPAATLAAETAIAVFRVTFTRWVHGRDPKAFKKLARASLDALRAVVAA